MASPWKRSMAQTLHRLPRAGPNADADLRGRTPEATAVRPRRSAYSRLPRWWLPGSGRIARATQHGIAERGPCIQHECAHPRLVDQAVAVEHGEMVSDVSRRPAQMNRERRGMDRLVQRPEDVGTCLTDEALELVMAFARRPRPHVASASCGIANGYGCTWREVDGRRARPSEGRRHE